MYNKQTNKNTNGSSGDGKMMPFARVQPGVLSMDN
jgi:hypothetical protein